MHKIEIIPIAKKKSVRRGIPEEWIIQALISPSQIGRYWEEEKDEDRM